jgi:excisionase family DNA binding protein
MTGGEVATVQPDDTPNDQDVAQILHRIEEHLSMMREAQQTARREWLTVREVAQELQVSRDTIERLVASGRLRATQIRTPAASGRRCRHRIRREWIEEFLLDNTKVPDQHRHQRQRRDWHRPAHDFIG